jgi:hypothetical protein
MAVKKAPPEANFKLGNKLISLSIYCSRSNMLLTIDCGTAMEMRPRLSEQYWNFRRGSTTYTLMKEAAGSNRNVGTLDRL